MKQESRNKNIDIARGIAIILMVMGHIGFGARFDFYIHTFHMPFWFLISGYFYKQNSIENCVVKNVKNLIVPYIVYGIADIMFTWVLKKGFPVSDLKHLLWINQEGITVSGALWFLTAMFFCQITMHLIIKYISNCYLRTTVVVALFIFGVSIKCLIHAYLPWALNAALVGGLLYYIGWMAKEKFYIFHEIFEKCGPIIYILWVGISAFMCNMNSYINMRTSSYGNPILFIVNAVNMTLLLYGVSVFISRYKMIKEVLTYIGENSITYLCTNQIVIIGCTYVCEKIGIMHSTQNIIVLMFSLMIMTVGSFIVNGTNLRYTIGRF